MKVRRTLKSVAVFEFATAAGLISFWMVRLVVGLEAETAPKLDFAYEHAFPLIDIVLGIVLTISGCLLFKGHDLGKTLSMVCAGGLIILGLVDYSFVYRDVVYAISMVTMVSNGFLSLWCIILGLYILLKLRQLKTRK